MADNDTAALVVALSAQLTRFETNMKGAVDIADRRTKEIETRFDKLNSALAAKAQLLSSTAIGNLGFIGPLITALGPAGLVAAAGLGTAVGVVLALANATGEYAEKAKRLKDAAETTDITITQFKLLSATGKTVGLDFEETSAFLTKFLANLEALRNGGGPLYDALLKIDRGLLNQLSVTKDSAKAVDLLVAAFAKLDDQTKKLDLSKAAGGKGGLAAVRLLDSLGKSGGLKGLEANAPPFDEGQIERAANLKRDIDAIRSKTATVWGGMFSDAILENQKGTAQNLHDIALWVEKIVGTKERAARTGNPIGAEVDDLVAERDRLNAQLKELEAAAVAKPLQDARDAQRELMEALEKDRGWTKDELAKIEAPPVVALDQVKKRLAEIDQQLSAIREKFNGELPSAIKAITPPTTKPISLREAREGVSPPADPDEASPSVKLDQLQKKIAVLGDAITVGEQWERKLLEIKVATDRAGISDDTAARAKAAFTLTVRASAIAALERLGIASQQEIVEGKLIALEKDRIKNGLTLAQVERAKVAIAREANDAANAARERLGIATQQQIVETRLNQIEQDRIRNGLSDQEVQRAKVVALREAKDAADALTVRQSYLPGLTQLAIDARNTRKAIDEVSVNSLNGLADGLTDAITGTKSFSDAFRDMANSIIRDIVRMALKQAVLGPLASTLAQLGGGFGGANPAVPGATNIVGIAGNVPVPTFAEGGVIPPGGLAFVSEHKNPRLLRAPANEPIVVTPNDVRPSGGGGSKVNVVINDMSGHANVQQQPSGDGGLSIEVLVPGIEAMLADRKARGRGSFARVDRKSPLRG